MKILENGLKVLRQLFPPYLLLIVLAPIVVGSVINSELLNFKYLIISLFWMLLFTIPLAILQKKTLYRLVLLFYFTLGFVEILHWVLLKSPLSATGLLAVMGGKRILASSMPSGTSLWGLLFLIPYVLVFIKAWRTPPTGKGEKIRWFFLGGAALAFCAFLLYVARAPAKYQNLPQLGKVAMAIPGEIGQHLNPVPKKVEAKSHSGLEQQLFVLILGESCSRNHMSLYNPSINTNPQLSKRTDLIRYEDVISSHSVTMQCVPTLLSQSNLDNELNFAESVDLMDVFHSAGFTTYWISNQSAVGTAYRPINRIGRKADHTTYVNLSLNSPLEAMETRSYDLKLVEPFKKVLEAEGDKKFIVLHLMGCHSNYTKRYPQDFKSTGKAGSPKDQLISAYRDAIRYNDQVVDHLFTVLAEDTRSKDLAATAIYLSDHGENVYDEEDLVGHDYRDSIPRSNVEIPFIVWLSPAFERQKDSLANVIRINRNRPFVTDDLFHAVMDINQIQSHYLEEKRSVFNNLYDSGKKRILADKQDYDLK